MISWNATDFFRNLTEANRLAASLNAKFCQVSGPAGFEECLSVFNSAKCIIAVSDIEDGILSIANTPHTTKMKTVFIAIRHRVDDMKARNMAMDTIRELFRQFATRLILEKTTVEQEGIYLDDDIRLNEIDRYFFSGCACAYFQFTVTHYESLEINEQEWL